jgi:hypothetical protein
MNPPGRTNNRANNAFGNALTTTSAMS